MWLLNKVIFIFLMFYKLNTSAFFQKLNIYKTIYFSKPSIVNMLTNQINYNKKILSISPGGYKGFYTLGICKFIKENYDLSEYVFSGASAGAWNSLLLVSRHGIGEIQKKIIDDSLMKINSLEKLELTIKQRILENYETDDFYLHKLYIGVTTVDKYKSKTIIYNSFESLEDALDCCVASSHIPFFTGGLTKTYRKTFVFDGGFSKYPYLNTTSPILHIHPNIWNRFSQNKSVFNISDYTTLFSKTNYPFELLIEQGYLDAKNHKKYLDSIF
jgi:hypothetical protein